MKDEKKIMSLLVLLFAVLMSLPFLVPGCGFTALFGFVPLLCMERVASQSGIRRVWRWHFPAFLLWNAFTTFWVCNATVGGGIFAIAANSLQMSLIFGIFRKSSRYLRGVLPYILLAALWIAWERRYLTGGEISWPWLVLGNAFAGSTGLVQWYEFTGSLGGSLWVWASNLAIFGMMVMLSDGSWNRCGIKARAAAVTASLAVIFVPMICSAILWSGFREEGETLDVAILQPNIDPYNKFTAMTQDRQNAILSGLAEDAMESCGDRLLLLAPETFTGDVIVGNANESPTVRRFASLLSAHPGAYMLMGASTRDYIMSDERPSQTARSLSDDVWIESHNSAIMLDGNGVRDIYHKSKLVVGVEMIPYPAVFRPIDDMLGGVMGRCVGQDSISLLYAGEVPVGCAVCYESVYGEFCTGYVRAGAQLLAIITNDAWWGDTPGYRQHLRYACLRAIETRRDIARCANTGISAFINPRGEIVSRTEWYGDGILSGKVHLSGRETFFVRYGDIVGRLCVFIAVMLAAVAAVRRFGGSGRF